MQEHGIRERQDLQRLLRESISCLGEDLLLLGEEVSEWQDSRRRIDLLALDRTGALVVIELKRTEDGGHMELQAIRYAAMVSTLRFHEVAAAHSRFRGLEHAEAESAILEFLDLTEAPADFGKRVRIVLVSADFSRELTSAVLWLNDNGLDIRCVRVRPYLLDHRTVVEIDQIIPLREAQDYWVRNKVKQEESREVAESSADFTRYDLTVDGQVFPNLWKRTLVWKVIAIALKNGLTLDRLTAIIPSQKLAIVDGALSGQEFLEAAGREKAAKGYVFRPKRMFVDDDHLIHVEGKTIAVSKMWGLPSLPLLDEIIAAVPSVDISFRRVEAAS